MLMSRLSAYQIYLGMEGTLAFCFAMIFTASQVYRIQVVGLNPFQLVLVGTALEVSAFLFEIPTGVVADTISRRLSIIIGVILLGISFVWEGSVALSAVSLLAQVVSGIGYTFTSGATQAWISDEIGEVEANRAFLRSSQLGSATSFVGVLGSMVLASISLSLAMITGGLLIMVLGLVLILIMPERGFRPAPRGERSTWHAAFDTFRQGVNVVRASGTLVAILIIAVNWGAFSEGLDRLWEAHMLTNFSFPGFVDWSPVVWFGLLGLVSRLPSVLAVEVIRRHVDTNNHRAVSSTLMILTGVLILAMVGLGLATSFVFVIGVTLVIRTIRAAVQPLYAAWLNQHTPSAVRATIFSMSGQADAFGQILGGPAVGLIGTLFSLRAVMVVAGLLLLPSVGIYRRTLDEKTVSSSGSS